MTKKELEDFATKLDELSKQADAAAVLAGGNTAQRIASLTLANHLLVANLVEWLFVNLPRGKNLENFGTLNEIACYLSAVMQKLYAEEIAAMKRGA